MQEIIEVYTPSKTFNEYELLKEVEYISTQEVNLPYDVLARYAIPYKKGFNILVELQVSSKWCAEHDIDDFIDLVVYTYDGDLEDLSADIELEIVAFDENWNTLEEQMRALTQKWYAELESLFPNVELSVDEIIELKKAFSESSFNIIRVFETSFDVGLDYVQKLATPLDKNIEAILDYSELGQRIIKNNSRYYHLFSTGRIVEFLNN